ncbi:MAG: glycosyl hydrolase [Ectothiorhodospiraceae bacterium]|nr:glycosyl hydrolase [Ectothiorhodospiraceae bacterium]
MNLSTAEILALISALAFVPIAAITLYNIVAAPRLRKPPDGQPSEFPEVSILIPARNEEGNIGACIESLMKQTYPNLSITVLNDQSTDNTAEIVRSYADQDKRLQLYDGKPLPDGWYGKAWACAQLGEEAQGDILLFTDADTYHDPDAVSHTVAWLNGTDAGMISAFSQQVTVSFMERLVVPLVDMLLYCLLPLPLVYKLRSPSVAGANGQWIAFTRNAYNSIGGHESVRNNIVEDIELSRVAKRRGVKVLTTAGTGAVYCRMYKNAAEVVEGFTKNLFAIAGSNVIIFAAGSAALFAAFILPYALVAVPGVMEYALMLVAANIALRVAVAVVYKHPVVLGAVLHPVGIMVLIGMGIRSIVKTYQGSVIWKERTIPTSRHA